MSIPSRRIIKRAFRPIIAIFFIFTPSKSSMTLTLQINFFVKRTFSALLLSVAITSLHAQTTYLPLRSVEYEMLERLETLSGALSPDFPSSVKPLERKGVMEFLKKQQKTAMFAEHNLSRTDLENMYRAISINGEWIETADGSDGAIRSNRPILKYFYRTQANLLHVHNEDFFLSVNPVLYLQAMPEKPEWSLRYINTRGAEIRGRILNRVGFYTMVADNQEEAVNYIRNWEAQNKAFPGADYYTLNSNGSYDYLMARGYVDIGAIHDHLNITFGFDKHFSGDGMRSLLLSDFSAPATFLRLRTKLGAIHYENLFLELTPDYLRGSDRRLPRKYASIHQLNANVNRWLNIGIFESTMYNPANDLKAHYLVPVIFYNSVLRSLNADQKTSLGFNFKAIALKRLQWYGQAYFDQLQLSELSNGSWTNQWGAQLGLKYFNAFGIANLDLQTEGNIVRPFTYSSDDQVQNYTHYNQPLAHPYGAAFAELIGLARFQPGPRWYITAKTIVSKRGVDSTAQINQGNDLFKLHSSREFDNGYGLTGITSRQTWYTNINLAYEVRPNIFLEAGATHLQRSQSGIQLPSSTFLYGGIRMNISRREFDYH
jgi:hypothetical protein